MTTPTFQIAAPQLYPLPYVDTTNTTPVQLLSFDVPRNDTLALDFVIRATRTDGTFGSAAFRRQVTAINNAGTVTIPQDEVIGTDYNPGGWTVAVSVSTTNVVVTVTGPSSSTVRWTAAAIAIL